MSTNKIAWADKPNDGPRNWVKIISPKPKFPIETLMVNSAVVGVYTHYMPGASAAERSRTQPCTGSKLFCAGCVQQRSKRWKGYVAVWNVKYGQYLICEVTRDAVRSCPALVDPAKDLRGQMLKLERMGSSPNSPVMAYVWTPAKKPYLPAPLDVHSQLCRLWGFEKAPWMGNDGTSTSGPFGPSLADHERESRE